MRAERRGITQFEHTCTGGKVFEWYIEINEVSVGKREF